MTNTMPRKAMLCELTYYSGVWRKAAVLLWLVFVLSLIAQPASGGTLPGVSVGHPEPGDYTPLAYCSDNPFFNDGYGGQCTAFCWGRTMEKLGIPLPEWGNAQTWCDEARNISYEVGQEAWPNSIAVWIYTADPSIGHVAFVEEVSGEQVLFNEANWNPSDHVGWGYGYSGVDGTNPGPKTLSKANMVNGRRSFSGNVWQLSGYIYLDGSPGAPHHVTGYGTGMAIAGASVTLRANGIVQTLTSGGDGSWIVPWYQAGTAVDVSIQKAGYRVLHYILTITGGGKSAEAEKASSNEDPLIPDSNAPTSTRFQVNDHVQVCHTGVGLRARYPMYDSPPLAVMGDGQLGTVMGGSASYNGYQWWLIRYDSLSPTVTWSAEGEPATPGVYYLEQITVPTYPELSVVPSSQSVGAGAGLAYINVSNTGTGDMIWSATSNAGWLHFVSGTNIGINSGTIQCPCDANPGSSPRTGTIQVTATGASGSPKNVTVTQAGTVTPPPQPPYIMVSSGGYPGPYVEIGDSTPSTDDGTDFGDVAVDRGKSQVFVIQNLCGDNGAILQLTGSPMVSVSGSSDFWIYEQPDRSSLAFTVITGFTLTFSPHSTGLKQAVVSIISNDVNRSPYQFVTVHGIIGCNRSRDYRVSFRICQEREKCCTG